MPSPGVSQRASHLPAELTSLVGRRAELAAIRRHLGEAPLVTLTGPGGVGKTRLALRTARDLAGHYRDGATFVALAEVRESAGVTAAIVGALGLQDRSTEWSGAMLVTQLVDRRLLLVLDNCEHVLDEAASLAGTLLRGCPDLQVIATSRQALGVAGEVTEEILAMSMPDPADSAPGEAWRSDAVSLFVERAAARRGGFALDANSAPAVLELCRRLDGLPLALELAAVRLDALGIGALTSGLDERMTLLGTGDRSYLPHQRTMEATIDWSYQLLDDAERLLWSRLSVFVGGFEIDAIEAVCADDELPRASIAGLVASLVEKSLVHRLQRTGRERFRILEVLRDFARERLREHGTERDLRLRHLAWVRSVAAVAGAHDSREAAAFARIRADRSNLWAALEFCAGDAELAEQGVAICRDLFEYWLTEGHFSKVIGILTAFLDAAPGPSKMRADALWVSSLLSAAQSDHDKALAHGEEALAVGRAVGDAASVAFALIALGAACWVGSRPEEAIAHADQAVKLGQAMGLPFATLAAMDVRGIAEVFSGDLDAGIRTGYETIALSEQSGEGAVRAYAYHFLSIAELRAGNPGEGKRLARAGIEIRRDLGDVTGVAHLAEVLAFVAIAEGDHRRATTLLGGADALWRIAAGKEYEPLLAAQADAAAAARGRLGQRGYDAAFGAGQAMSRDELIGYSLGLAEPPAPARRPAVAEQPGGLSRREMEVARLVADGTSNAAVATQLFISERTVESHVANIFNKLGIDSRVAIARWVTALDAVGGAEGAVRV